MNSANCWKSLFDFNDGLCGTFPNEKLELFQSDAWAKVSSSQLVGRSVGSGQTAGREAVRAAGLKLKLKRFQTLFPKPLRQIFF